MVNAKVLSSLNAIGLTQYEAKVYTALASEGVATAKDISNVCGIPYGKVYEILTSLANKGFILVLPSKPMKYKVVNPDKVVDIIKSNNLKKIEDAKKVILKELLPLFNKHDSSDFEDVYWVIHGRSAINKKISELLSKAKKYIYILTSSNGVIRLGCCADLITKAAKKGVDVVIISKVTDENKPIVKRFKSCKIINSDVKGHLILIDGKEVLFFDAIPDDTDVNYGRDSGILSRNPTFVQFMESFFELRSKFK